MNSRSKRIVNLALRNIENKGEIDDSIIPTNTLHSSETCLPPVSEVEQLLDVNKIPIDQQVCNDESNLGFDLDQNISFQPGVSSLNLQWNRNLDDDLQSLFEGDFSDDDPTYKPDNSEFIHPENSFELPFNDRQSDIQCVTESSNITMQNATLNSLDEDLNTETEAILLVRSLLLGIIDTVWKTVKPLKRWRISDPKCWKKNIAKKRRAEGLSYETTKNKLRPAKIPKLVDCSRCKYTCSELFSEEQCHTLCRKYWSLGFIEQKNFILSNIVVKTPNRIFVNRKRATIRSNSKQYFFTLNNDKRQVCQKFFCKTLCIAPSVISNAVKHRSNLGFYSLECDPRGHHEPPNKTPLVKIDEVRKHIESFPVMESHYGRKDSKRKYLNANLSISKMYQLYVEKCIQDKTKPLSEITYRRIFSTDYNLSFFTPKKDQCLLCTRYKRSDAEGKKLIEASYQEHIKRKEVCNKEKTKDKERASKEKSFLSATFDMQAILQIPSAEIGLLYYSRKLTVYNLVVYESALPNDAYCFTWSEINGKKGTSEIGSVLYYYLLNCVPEHVTELSLFSDTCGGQNRNQFITAILLWSVQNIEHLQVIEQKFLESGHTYMEADSVHSSIESAKKHSSVYSMTEWMNIFKRARSKGKYKCGNKMVNKKPYNVKEFKYNEFKDIKHLAQNIIKNRTKDTKGNTVKWLKIKRIRYVKGDLKMYFNYDLSDELLSIDFNDTSGENLVVTKPKCNEHKYSTRKKSTQKVDSPSRNFSELNVQYQFPNELKPLYHDSLHITATKKKDLIKLCDTGVIPEEYHGWYKSIKSNNETVDYVPDVPASEMASDEDEE